LAEHVVDERGFAVVNVSNDGDISDLWICGHGPPKSAPRLTVPPGLGPP
jgi:hypothetical protein